MTQKKKFNKIKMNVKWKGKETNEAMWTMWPMPHKHYAKTERQKILTSIKCREFKET